MSERQPPLYDDILSSTRDGLGGLRLFQIDISGSYLGGDQRAELTSILILAMDEVDARLAAEIMFLTTEEQFPAAIFETIRRASCRDRGQYDGSCEAGTMFICAEPVHSDFADELLAHIEAAVEPGWTLH